MSPQDWDKVKQVFERALNIPESARRDYVLQECCEPPMQDLLLNLLANHTLTSTSPKPASQAIRLRLGLLVAGRFRIVRFHCIRRHGGGLRSL